MFFHSAPQVAAYVKRNSILFIFKSDPVKELAVPPEVVANLEVLDAAKERDLLTEFCGKHGVKNQKVLIVLDHEVVFEKAFLGPDTDNKAVQDHFITQVPFDNANRSVASLKQDNHHLRLFVTNQALYAELATVLEQLSNKIVMIAPAAAFGVSKITRTSSAEIERLFENTPPATATFLPQIV